MIKTVEFNSKVDGEHILVLGAVHGNEVCGPIAINRMINFLEKNPLPKGKVTFAPIVNIEAFDRKTRFIKTNLNRVVQDDSFEQEYEYLLGRELAKLIKASDLVLDIHSFTASGEPFLVEELENHLQQELTSKIGVKTAISNLAGCISKVAIGNTTAYFAAKNNIPAVVLECGQHHDPKSIEVAFMAIKNLLFLNNIYNVERYKVWEVFFKTTPSEFTKDYYNLEKIRAGETLTTSGITSSKDCYIILPNKNASLGAEWFYLADKEF